MTGAKIEFRHRSWGLSSTRAESSQAAVLSYVGGVALQFDGAAGLQTEEFDVAHRFLSAQGLPRSSTTA